jgi:hypothetical protein
MSDEQTPGSEPQRDTRGRYVKGFSGNPAGKPAGIMSEAARAAAGLLNASAPVLVSKAIELALLGKSGPLKYCLDRIIAPQKDQPVIFEAPEGDRPGEVPDFAGMMATVAAAAAEGSITPSQAATLCQAFADHARGLETQQRVAQQRLAADAPAVWNRMQLRACVALADGVREISEEAGEVDDRVPPLCLPIMRTGRRALIELAKIEDHAAQMWPMKPSWLSTRCRRITRGIRSRPRWPSSGISCRNTSTITCTGSNRRSRRGSPHARRPASPTRSIAPGFSSRWRCGPPGWRENHLNPPDISGGA